MRDGKWKAMHTVSFDNANLQLFGSSGGSGTAQMDFSKDTDAVDVHVCAFDGCDTTSYERFDSKTGKHIARLANNIKVDIAGFLNHPKTRNVKYVMYEHEKLTTEALHTNNNSGRDNAMDLADLDYFKSYFEPSMVFYVMSITYDCSLWIIYAVSDVGRDCSQGSPGGYFLYAKGANVSKTMSLVFPSRPELSRYKLSTMTPMNIKARDGEDIMCYLSSPSESEKSPLVLFVHGGPQARDHWGYNPVCQLLCNRGFRVLQVNYRGSIGFGERFLKLGMNGQFYKSVQTDITDAANALSSEDGIAIFGASFGGYSALWAMTSEAEMYRCAVVVCPLTVVGAANEQGGKMFGGSPLIAKYWQQVFGKDVSTNEGVARQASPLYQLGNIANQASIQIFHGENDPRAPFKHSVRVVDELQKQIRNGKNLSGEFISFADEGHGISKEENVLYMYARIEKYLCNHFGIESARDGYGIENSTAAIRWSSNDAILMNNSAVEECNSSKKQQ